MLRKCKTVIATIVVTVMMFSVFSYAGSTGNGTQERIMEDAGASVQQQGRMKASVPGSLKDCRKIV